MTGQLHNKVVVITGAAAGIGKATARLFGEEGALLALCDIDGDGLQAVAADLRTNGVDVLATQVDIGDEEQIISFVSATVERFGGVDVLVNNATLTAPQAPLLHQERSEFQRALNVGVFAHWTFMQQCHPHMAGKSGSIINLVSAAYKMAFEGYASYAADKAAIRALSVVAAREWGKDGIRVNTLAPSALTDTIENNLPPEQTEYVKKALSSGALGRYGLPYEDIAPAALFLATEQSRWVSGQNLNVDGGSINLV